MDGPSMLHPGSPPPSWPQNEVKILIDSGTSPLMPLCGSAIGLAPIIFFKTDPWGHIPVFIFYANILYNGANIKRNKHSHREASISCYRGVLNKENVQCSTFTGMRDLKESNNLHRRIKSGKVYHLYPIPLQVMQSN